MPRRISLVLGIGVLVLGATAAWLLARPSPPADTFVSDASTSTIELGGQAPALMIVGEIVGDPTATDPSEWVAERHPLTVSVAVDRVLFDRVTPREYQDGSYLREDDKAPAVGDRVLVAIEAGTLPADDPGTLVAWLTPTTADSVRWSATLARLDGDSVSFLGPNAAKFDSHLSFVASTFGVSGLSAMTELGLQLTDQYLDVDKRSGEQTNYFDALLQLSNAVDDTYRTNWEAADPEVRGLQVETAPADVWAKVITLPVVYRFDLQVADYPVDAVVLVRSATGISSSVSIELDQPGDSIAALPGESLEIVIARLDDLRGEPIATILFDEWSKGHGLLVDVSDREGVVTASITVADKDTFAQVRPRS